MNAASRLSHIPHVCRRAALLAALIAALAQPAWAQNSGGHVEQDGPDYIYVGNASSGSTVTITSTQDKDSGGNTVDLTHVYGGRSNSQSVDGNSVEANRIPGMPFQLPGNLFGGSTNSGDAKANTVSMNNSQVLGSVYGNHTEEGNAQGDGTANVTLTEQAAVSNHVYGGWIGGSANSHTVSGNTVRLEDDAQVGDANVDGGNVYGGYSAATGKLAGDVAVRDNTVELANQAQVWRSNNSSQSGHVFGGYAVTGDVAGNKVRIEGGQRAGYGGVWVQGDVTANHAKAGNATGGNDLDQPDVFLNAEAGQIDGNVIGGASDTNGNVTGHVVKIAGGAVGSSAGGSNIYGGKGNGGSIQNNTIVLAGEANLDYSTLWGHNGGGTGTHNNTLRVEVKGEQVQAVHNFDTWHFALPNDLQQGSSDPAQAEIMLKVTNQGGALAIDGDRVTVSTDGGGLALGLNERAVLLSLVHGTINYTSTTSERTAWLDGEPAGLPALVYELYTGFEPNQLDIWLNEKYLYGSGGTNTPGQREQGNTLTLTGGEATAAFGGRSNVAGTVSGNTLIIDGAATLKPLNPSHLSYDLSGKAYGGYADAGNATGNTVTLSSSMSGQTAGFALYGGFSGNGGEATSGNTLQVQGSEVSVPAINNFETLSFALGTTTGGAMLTISGGAPTVFSTMLNVGADVAAAAPLLSVGEQFVLLHNPNGLHNRSGAALVQGRDYRKLNPGSGYDFELSNTDTSIIATITKAPPYTITTSIAQGEGTVKCTPAIPGERMECTATPAEGHTFGSMTLTDGSNNNTCTTNTCTLTGVTGNVSVTATFIKKKYTVTAIAGSGGKVKCTPPDIVEYGDTVECTATAKTGLTLEKTGLTLEKLEISDGATTASCTTSPSCTAKLTGVKGKVTATATFKASGGTVTGPAQPVPTLGEVGLLLSGIALAGAASPALRRREKRGKKTDTCQ